MYEARAQALLALKPPLADYQDWLNFGLKTLICDELAPYHPPEVLVNSARHRPLTLWQEHMGVTWRHFDHPRHSELFFHAQKLINAMEDPLDLHWDKFTTLLHKAISRTTLRLSVAALKSIGEPSDSKPQLNKEPAPRIVLAEEAAKTTLPQPHEWREIEIAFTSDQRLQIKIGIQTETRNFEEMGFASKKSGLPVLAWGTLRTLAEREGTIGATGDGRAWRLIEKRIQEIRQVFRRHFGLNEDPFDFIKKTRGNVSDYGYRSKFKITCRHSYHA